LPHTEKAAFKNKKFAVGPKLKVSGGGFLAHIYAYNMFSEKFKFWFFYECLKILRKVHFFSEHSVSRQKILPSTQYAGNNFYRLLSMQAIIFTTS
jgi:hypothetical protein